MIFSNIYYDGNEESLPVACVKLDEGFAPLYQLIPEIPGVCHPDSGKPLPLGAPIDHTNSLIYLSQWKKEIETISNDLLSLTEKLPQDEVRFAPPVWKANSFRDFYAFEQHVKTARALRNLEVAPQWYEIPVFYFSNHQVFSTDRDNINFPFGGRELDFEMEIGAVICKSGSNLTLENATSHIGGYCLLNDWSLRDAQRQEMAVGLGPAKGKDFATSLGPWLITPDELSPHQSGKGYDIEVSTYVNERLLSNGNWKTIHYSFAEMLVRASQNVTLEPGDVIGSGTIGTGCILELRPENTGGWLKRGDVVRMESDRLGTLTNTIT
jgi:fumarylacetoacetate (FAA) hydrolase